MQAQFLRSFSVGSATVSSSPSSSQYDFAKCRVSSSFLAKSSLALQKKKKIFGSVCMRDCRNGVPVMRIVSQTGVEESHHSTGGEFSSAGGMDGIDVEARDKNPQTKQLLSSTGAPARFPPGTYFRELSFTDHHVLVLGIIACVMTGALSCVMLAAIPTLIAMKRAAESLGKLADTAREELPGTMAAVRLSGMEISDLTMELSDLGQEISAGVRSSSREVRAPEDGIRRIGNFTPIAVAGEGERAGGGGETSSGWRSKKYSRGADAGSQLGVQLGNSGSSV